MFATRITRKTKVLHLEAQLRRAGGDPQPADADPEERDATPFRLGGRGTPIRVEEVGMQMPKNMPNLHQELRAAGGLLGAVRDRISLEPDLRDLRISKDTIVVHNYAVAMGVSGIRERLHARQSYYGAPRYDWIATTGEDDDDGEWFGRLLALFSCYVGQRRREFALIKWLDLIDVPRDHVIGAHHFTYWNRPPRVELLSSVCRRAQFVTSPLAHGREPVFLILPYAETPDEEDEADDA